MKKKGTSMASSAVNLKEEEIDTDDEDTFALERDEPRPDVEDTGYLKSGEAEPASTRRQSWEEGGGNEAPLVRTSSYVTALHLDADADAGAGAGADSDSDADVLEGLSPALLAKLQQPRASVVSFGAELVMRENSALPPLSPNGDSDDEMEA